MFHLNANLPQRGLRMIRVLFRNLGRNGARADVQALPGDAVRVTIKVARSWNFTCGSHAYLYMPMIGLWTSHPFSVAWSQDESSMLEYDDKEKPLPMTHQDLLEGEKKQYFSFIIRRRTGFTNSLYNKAANSPNGRFSTLCFTEGPYGSQSMASYGTVLLFAAGVGITHQVPHVRELVAGYGNGNVSTRKVLLVWIIQSQEHLEWIRGWMTTILALPKRREVLRIQLFITRPQSSKEMYSPSNSVQMFPGKPNIRSLVDTEVSQGVGAVGVSVCGVGALADDVRSACRRWQDKVVLDIQEEAFSW
jgi:predicted ferric reductase